MNIPTNLHIDISWIRQREITSTIRSKIIGLLIAQTESSIEFQNCSFDFTRKNAAIQISVMLSGENIDLQWTYKLTRSELVNHDKDELAAIAYDRFLADLNDGHILLSQY